MTYYRERFAYRKGEYPICEEVAERSPALPFFPGLSEQAVARVAQSLKAALSR